MLHRRRFVHRFGGLHGRLRRHVDNTRCDGRVDPPRSGTPNHGAAASGAPSNASRPPGASTTTRSHRSTSSGACVVSSTVVPASARRRSTARTSREVAGSRPLVGSSRASTAGRVSSSTAMLARLRCPPERLRTTTSARSVSSRSDSTRSTTWSSSASLTVRGSLSRAAYRSVDLSGRSRWMMSSCGTRPTSTARRSCATSTPSTVTDPTGGCVQADERLEQRCLPCPAPTDQRDHLARLDGQRDPVDQRPTPLVRETSVARTRGWRTAVVVIS